MLITKYGEKEYKNNIDVKEHEVIIDIMNSEPVSVKQAFMY